VRDPEFLAYVEAIEHRLTSHRRREQVLNPPDFDLARRWFRGGVPLSTILDAIVAAEREGETLLSLAPLRRRVETRRSRAGARGPSDPSSP
jgi:hypothetical protein